MPHEKVIMLELSEEEFDSLLGHLEDDLELSPDEMPYWNTDRGQHVQAVAKRMAEQARRIRGRGQSHTRAAQKAR